MFFDAPYRAAGELFHEKTLSKRGKKELFRVMVHWGFSTIYHAKKTKKKKL